MKTRRVLYLTFSICVIVIIIASAILAGCTKPVTPTATTPAATTPKPTTPAATTPAATTPATTAPATTKPAATPAATVLKWKLQSNNAPTVTTFAVTLTGMVDDIAKMSDGRLVITPYGANVLVPTAEQLNAVTNGVVEMQQSTGEYWLGIMPWALAEETTPFTLKDGVDFMEFFYFWENGKVLDWIRKEYTPRGNYFLGTIPGDGNNFISKKPIVTMDDVRKMLIRTPGMKAQLFQAMGAKTVSIPGSEVYTALQLGTVDAATWSKAASFYAQKWYEVAKYISGLNIHGSHGEHITVNLKSWDALPNDLKQMVSTSQVRWAWRNFTFDRADNVEKLALMVKQYGVTYQDVNDEVRAEAAKAAAKVLADYRVKDAKSGEYAAFIEGYMKYRGYWK